MALYAFDGTNQRLSRKDGSLDPKATNVGRFYRAYVAAEGRRLGREIDHRQRGSIHLDGINLRSVPLRQVRAVTDR